MPQRTAELLHALGALLVCAVLGVGLTFLLWPLWVWVEAFTGFESVGSAVPAWWCFALTTSALFLAWLGRQRQRRRP